MKKPDFDNLKNTITCKKEGQVPIIELHIDKGYKEKFLKREIKNTHDEIEFAIKNNHDFLLLSSGILKPAQSLGQKSENSKDRWANERKGVISTLHDFEQYNWPAVLGKDGEIISNTKTQLPRGMGLIITCGKIFTASWMLMGFDNFCISLYDNKNLVKKVIEKVAGIQFEYFKNIIEIEKDLIIAAVDDIAYTEGLMISADFIRGNVFPWYEKMGKICRHHDIPFIYHSDGNISQILDDLLTCGFSAIHPVEPKAMNILELKKKYKDKLCLLGNIELDILIRGKPEDVKKLVEYNLKNVASEGFYACGSSNSVTETVPVENYLALVETIKKFNLSL